MFLLFAIRNVSEHLRILYSNNLSNLFTQMSRPGPAKGKHSSNTKMNKKTLIFSLFSFLALSQAAYAADFKVSGKIATLAEDEPCSGATYRVFLLSLIHI